VLALIVVLASVVAVNSEPVEQTETWGGGDTAGWASSSAGVNLAHTDGHLNMVFASQFLPEFVAAVARGPICGILVTNVSFRFLAVDMLPSSLRLYFRSAQSDNTWYLPLEAPALGEWRTYKAAVDFSVGWFMGPANSREQFVHDVASADRIGVYVRRRGSTAGQNYAIDDFTLQGLAVSDDDSDGDGMLNTWEYKHGLDARDPGDARADTDGDGMNNYLEYRAGTNPRDPTSVFQTEIEPADQPPQGVSRGIVVRWASQSNRTYSVWRTSDLVADSFAPLVTGIVATPPVNEYQDAGATNPGAGFYRIRVKESP
jgi:hypothetical protein